MEVSFENGAEKKLGKLDKFLMQVTEKACGKCYGLAFYETEIPVDILKEQQKKK